MTFELGDILLLGTSEGQTSRRLHSVKQTQGLGAEISFRDF